MSARFRGGVCIWGLCIWAFGAAAVGAHGPTGHWKLDGDARDAAVAARSGKVFGRGEFIPSIIGGAGGKALWCEGVDTAVRADAAGRLGDAFTITAWVCVLEARPGGILGGDGWSLELAKGAALKFSTGAAAAVETPAERVGVGQWYHVAVAGRRGGPCALYVNGDEAATGTSPAAAAGAPDAPLWIGRANGKPAGFVGLADDVRIYASALSSGDVARLTDEGLPWIRLKPTARQPFEQREFTLLDDDVVALIGGEDLYASQRAGHLETLLTAAAAPKRVHFRNMAWEGDTVFEQWRILNFGPWARQLERVGASVIIVQFGQVESLRGREGLAEFSAAYVKLLEELEKRTKRIVLVSPTPFEDAGPTLPAAAPRNEALKEYVALTERLAHDRGLAFVKLFQPPDPERPRPVKRGEEMTRDGMHLTPYGQAIWAREAAQQLGTRFADITRDAEPRFLSSTLEELRQAVVNKNELWLRAWRPPNWAFLNGDRITQPSSRDHVDQRVRWLPAEVQRYPVMVADEETKIARMAKDMKK
jgi:hypothetical protein